jgi:hypothetical protein
MVWFRTNREMATWLAFFALACQLSLSFGHVHISKLGAGTFDAGKLDTGKSGTGPSGVADQAAVETTERGDAPPPARPNDPIGAGGDFCAVCAHISLAAALILPVLAFILALVLFTRVFRWSVAAPALACGHYQPFSARGPLHA